MSTRPWQESIWFSPCYVIRELDRELSKGLNVFDRSLKHHRETWIAAISVICYGIDSPAEWWIQVPKNDPPDVLGMNIVPSHKGIGQDMSITPFEVFEINEHGKGTLEEQIQMKLKNKDYSKTVVIGYLRRAGFYNFRQVSAFVQSLRPNVVAVCLLTSEKLPECKLIQLYPQLGSISTNYREFCKGSEQRDYIEMFRGTKIERLDGTTEDKLTLIPD